MPESNDLCMCGHLFGHHALEGQAEMTFTGRCAIGQPDWVMLPGTYNKQPMLVNGKPIPNPLRCQCVKFQPGKQVILPLTEE